MRNLKSGNIDLTEFLSLSESEFEIKGRLIVISQTPSGAKHSDGS